MKRFLLVLGLLVLSVSNSLAMDLREGFDGKKWGEDCSKYFSDPEWKVYGGSPIWNKKDKTLLMPFDAASEAKSKFILKYFQTQQTKFEDFSLLNVYYGCSKETNKLSLVVIRYSVPSAKGILKKLVERLGKPTRTNISQSIWDLDELYVQYDQSIVFFYWKNAGHPN